jgi:acyl-CoA thioester hydrolase
MHETQITVRYSETDQMAVVYYANYFVWFEVARTEALKSLGFEYAQLEKEGYFLPVAESYCRYLKPACYGDKITLRTEIKEILKNRIITFEYIVYKNKEILAKGYTKHICLNRHKKITNLPSELVRKLKS